MIGKDIVMLELKDICFERNNKKILDHINLVLDKNKFYVITGPNGSGKSTLVKIIMELKNQILVKLYLKEKTLLIYQ